MKLIQLTLFVLGVHTAASTIPETLGDLYIIGGDDATPGQFPWQALLERSGSFICGGILVDALHVITAAHCVDSGHSASSYSVRLGETNRNIDEGSEQDIGVAKIDIRKDWIESTISNDIALLTLSANATLNDAVKPVDRLAKNKDVFTDEICVISGFGVSRLVIDDETNNIINREIPPVLQWVNIPVITNSECQSYYGSYVEDTNICVFDPQASACNGDSGGPMVCQIQGKNVLAGVTSFGSRWCDGPSAYTRVSSFRRWLKRKIRRSS